GEFSSVWDVLAALKSHDDRVQGWIGSKQSFGGSGRTSHIEFNVDWPAALQGKFLNAIESRVVSRFRERIPLTEDLLWQWMQDFHAEHGRWPVVSESRTAPDGSLWSAINCALEGGFRGLPGGSTLLNLRLSKLGIPSKLSE